MFYLNMESITATLHRAGFIWECSSAHRDAFMIVLLSSVAIPFIWGLWGIVVVWVVPMLLSNTFTDWPMYSLALPVCSCSGFRSW